MLSNSERNAVKKSAVIMLLTLVLPSMLIASVYASVSIEASISRDFGVTFEFTISNVTLYNSIKNNRLIMNETTVPDAIWRNLADKGYFRVEYFSPAISFNDTLQLVVSTFHLRGPDVINSTVNRAASTETFMANTMWRKFYLNITANFSYNFTQILAASLPEWTKSTPLDGATSFNYSDPTAEVMCSFSVRKDAANIYAVGETIIFDAPYETPWEDKLINSPALILIALAVVGLVVLAYRRIR